MQFQRAEMSGIQRRLQQAFAFREVPKDRTGLILPAAGPDGGSDNADERGRVKRALDKGDIAENLPKPCGIRITFGAAALMREQHDRKIGPRWLTVQPMDQPAKIGRLDRFVGNHG
jgi:hypothetical protein